MSDRSAIDGERTVSGVAPKFKLLKRKQKVAIFLFGGAGAVLALLYFGQGNKQQSSKEYVQPMRFANEQPVSAPPEPRPTQTSPSPPPMAATPAVQQRTLSGPMQGPVVPTQMPPPQQAPAPPKLLVIDDDRGGEQRQPMKVASADGQDEESDLAKSLRPTMLEGVTATVMPHLDKTIAQGRSIQCVMDTAIDSQLQGFARCHVAYDVVAEDGATVVLERDTVITGECRAGNSVRAGQTRVGVLWTRARTPKGVIIALASPATDMVGRSGIPGDVDNHWWARFGNALLFTMIDAGTQIISTELSKGGQTSINLNTASSTASDQFREDARIPPTITVHQGEIIGITAARDLDFYSVYRNHLRSRGE